MAKTGINRRLLLKLPCPVLCLTGLLLLAGCSQRPKEVLSEKKMIKLMADMEIAESYAGIADRGPSGGDTRYELGKGVLAANGVTQEQLDTTLAWYGRNLDDYSDLFAKVDKEIISRKKKLLNLSQDEVIEEGDILWRYGKNGMLSNLGNSQAWVLSVDDPDLQQGDRLEWTMHIDNNSQMNGVLGVEYTDGSSEAASSVFVGRNKIELICQTDTGKTVRRIYGSLRVKEEKNLPIFADSISLRRIPYDSVEYYSHRNLKRYGIPSPKVVKPVEEKDSLIVDEKLKSDSIKSGEDKVVRWKPNLDGDNDQRLNTPPRPTQQARKPMPKARQLNDDGKLKSQKKTTPKR